MKNITILALFLFFSTFCFSQYTINQNLGSGNTLVSVPSPGGLRASLVNRMFSDTTSANMTPIKFYGGAMIYTSSNNLLWTRNSAATSWSVVGQRFGLEDNLFGVDRSVNMNGFNMATLDGNWCFNCLVPTQRITIGNNTDSTNTMFLYANDGSQGIIEANASASLAINANSRILLRPNYGAAGLVVVLPNPTGYVNQTYISQAGDDLGEMGISILDPIDSVYELFIRPLDATGPGATTELVLYGAKRFPEVEQINDTSGYDVAMIERAEGKLRRMPSSLIGGSGGGGSDADTLYILWTGQSNTSGYNLGNVDTAFNSNVQGWNTVTNKWETLMRGQFPMGTYTPGVSWGTGGFGAQFDTATGSFFYFAKRLQEMTGKVIRVFNFSWGGQSITNWLPIGSNMTTINAEMTAAGNPHISYMAWMQGESDNSMTDSTYKNKLDSVIAQFDAQTWFGKGTPIFVITVAGGVGGNIQMNHVQKAIGSGQYDQRYQLIDATLEPVEVDNIHFTAQGQYNIGNKIIQLVYNPLAYVRNFRQADSLERERQILYAPNLNKGLVLRDSATNYTYFLKPPFVLNGNNSIGMVLASTNNQVSRLQSYSVDDATINNPTFRLRSIVAGNINGEIGFMRGASTTSDGYVSIFTNTAGTQTEKVRFPNAGGIAVQIGRVTIPQVAGNSELEADRFNIESFGVNNNFWSDNIIFNSTFVRQSAGFGIMGYNSGGNFALQTTGSSTAGSAATMSTKLLILNGGNVGIGTGMGASTSSITGAPFAVVGSAVGIGTVTPAASASLDMTSTTTGFLSPRMTTTQQNAISSPSTGLLIFNTDSAKHCYYTGSAWVCYGSGSGGGSASPGGSNTQVQFNDASAFNGDAGFVYDKTTDIATLTGGVNLSNLTSGRVPFASTSGFLTDDADMTFDGSKLSVGINSVGFSFVAGTTFGLQSFAVNNNFMSDNIVYNSGFKYVANGLGAINYYASGHWALQTAPNGSAGAAATMTTRALMTNTGNIFLGGSLASVSSGTGAVLTALATGKVGINNTSPTAYLELPAGTTAATTAPLKFTTGTSMTTPESGTMEYTTDDLFFTISTGTARKRFVFADPVGGLTINRVPYVSINGRLTDAATFLFDGSKLTVYGALQLDTELMTTTATLSATQYVVRVDASAGAVTVDLPDATTCQGRVYTIKLISNSANAMTIEPSGAQTIDGVSNISSSTQYAVYQIQSNGTNWDRLN